MIYIYLIGLIISFYFSFKYFVPKIEEWNNEKGLFDENWENYNIWLLYFTPFVWFLVIPCYIIYFIVTKFHNYMYNKFKN